MSTLEEFCDIAFSEHIDIYQIEMAVPGMGAAYIRAHGAAGIFIRRDATEAERTCWMAEELGHHFTGTDRILRYNTPDDWKAESRARRWAHSRLISPDAILTAARNTDDIYEIADALCVTVEFLIEAINGYVEQGLFKLAI